MFQHQHDWSVRADGDWFEWYCRTDGCLVTQPMRRSRPAAVTPVMQPEPEMART